MTYLVGGSLNWTDRGLDPPNPTTYLNDKAQQGRVFAKVDVDLNDRDHLSTLISYSHDRFQIPVDPTLIPGNTQEDEFGNPPPPYFPPDTQQTETENDLFGILSYRHDFDASRSLRIAGYVRHSAAKFFGDPQHALGSTQTCLGPTQDDCPGVSNVNRRADHVGLVTDYLQRLGDQHTLKFGLSVDQLWGNTAYDAYERVLIPPPDFQRTGQGADQPTATTGGAYAQDRFTVGKLTLTGGLRVDFQSASPGAGAPRRSDVGVSPRIGAAWAFTPDVVAHAFFGLLWIPPSVTDAAAGARLTPGAVQPGQPIPYDLRPEKDRYAEVGLKARVIRSLTLGVTLWGRLSTDQLDETEIGNTGITTPYNFAEGRAGGIEATADWVITQRLTAFGNVSFGTAQGKGISTATVSVRRRGQGQPRLADAGPLPDLDRQRGRELPGRTDAGHRPARVRQRPPHRRGQPEPCPRVGPGRPDAGTRLPRSSAPSDAGDRCREPLRCPVRLPDQQRIQREPLGAGPERVRARVDQLLTRTPGQVRAGGHSRADVRSRGLRPICA